MIKGSKGSRAIIDRMKFVPYFTGADALGWGMG